MFGTLNYICHCPWYIWLLLIWLLLLMLVFHEWDLKIPRPDALHVSMYTVREHQTRVNCQTRILYLCYTSGLCLCLCHKNIPRYKYTDHMIYMYIICIIWNVYFTVNTLYLVICSVVPPYWSIIQIQSLKNPCWNEGFQVWQKLEYIQLGFQVHVFCMCGWKTLPG